MSKRVVLMCFALAAMLVPNCLANNTGSMTDPRDGQVYKTVKIGNQTWMAENLNFKTAGGSCFHGRTTNCLRYGRLYPWYSAMEACPEGWHLPDSTEWNALFAAVGGIESAGKSLKFTEGWRNGGNGTDEFGFSALPVGFRYGSKTQSSENEYASYLSKYSGSSNASTSSDRTIYYFTVSNEGFEGALDRFAQFFISPLFNEGSVEREITAIDNEFSKNINNDSWRFTQLKNSQMKKESVFNRFSTGNKQTLSLPDIRDRLLVFYKKYYTSEIMNLCVYSKKPMAELVKFVEDLFILVPKLDNYQKPKYDEILPYDETNLKYLYKITPIKNIDQIIFNWFLPFCDNYYAHPLRYLSFIFGHEGLNSLTSSLYKDNLCNDF